MSANNINTELHSLETVNLCLKCEIQHYRPFAMQLYPYMYVSRTKGNANRMATYAIGLLECVTIRFFIKKNMFGF